MSATYYKDVFFSAEGFLNGIYVMGYKYVMHIQAFWIGYVIFPLTIELGKVVYNLIQEST